MSNSIHNAPIHSLTNQKSNRSLYTQNSQNSDEGKFTKQQQIHQTNEKESSRRQQPISQKINKLPSIGLQVNGKPGMREQKQDMRHKNVNGFDEMPVIPTRNVGGRYHEPEGIRRGSLQFGAVGGPQFNTIAVASLDRNQMKNLYGQTTNPLNMTGMSGTKPNNESQRSRMLRSSQGGRWFRSQSLMQEKTKIQSSPSNLQGLTTNFHAHDSKYTVKLQQYIKFYAWINQQLQDKAQPFQKYKISITDSVEQLKNKMENYLQSIIDLSNLPIDRPDSDWGQEMLVKFYSGYQQVLLQKIQSDDVKERGDEKVSVVLKKYKNCCYYGPVKDGKKHGFGYLHYFSGRFFEGLFENDQKIKGFEMDDSELYVGEYEKNQRHGQGILKTNQYLLCGRFTNGEFKVLGSQQQTSISPTRKGFKIQFSSAVFYMGSLIILQKNNNGDLFLGNMSEDGQKSGEGLEIFANGDLYIGNYQQGAPEGYGQYYWDSGAFYRGDFLSGMRHGKGKWMLLHGDRYQGDYLNDKKNGKGVYIWKSGDRYQGQFENDYRHGYGEMSWRDGTSYKGQWLNGIQVTKKFQIGHEQKAQKTVQTDKTKNSFKTAQTRTRVLKKQVINKSISRNSKHSHTIQQTSSQPARNPYLQSSANKRIPLQKLKAMLNPSNSIN